MIFFPDFFFFLGGGACASLAPDSYAYVYFRHRFHIFRYFVVVK